MAYRNLGFALMPSETSAQTPQSLESQQAPMRREMRKQVNNPAGYEYAGGITCKIRIRLVIHEDSVARARLSPWLCVHREVRVACGVPNWVRDGVLPRPSVSRDVKSKGLTGNCITGTSLQAVKSIQYMRDPLLIGRTHHSGASFPICSMKNCC